MDDLITETVTYHGREFQYYAIDNAAYFAPVDEVTPIQAGSLGGPPSAVLTTYPFSRTKPSASASCTTSSPGSSTAG